MTGSATQRHYNHVLAQMDETGYRQVADALIAPSDDIEHERFTIQLVKASML